MRKTNFLPILVFILTISSMFNGRAQINTPTSEYDRAVGSPEMVVTMNLDFSNDNSNNIVSLFPKLTNLTDVQITGMTNLDIAALKELKSVAKLTFYNLEEIDVTQLITQLSTLNNLTELVFQNCQLKELPAGFVDLTRLRKLTITQDEELDVKSVTAVVAKLPNLVTLRIFGNELQSLPPQISAMKQVRMLDISNNNLDNIPSEIAGMSSLDTLYADGNVFIDPIVALSRLKNLKLKYLTIDSLIADATTMITLQKLLPKTKIVAIAGITNQSVQLPDSITMRAMNTSKVPDEDTSVFVGQFQTEKTSLKVYSEAYTHYTVYFPKSNAIPYDSLLFDQRFESLDYINNISKVRNDRGIFVRTFMNDDKKRINSGSISFMFNKSKKSGPYFVLDDANVEKSWFYNNNYKELKAYSNVKWKYTGGLSTRDFKKKFIALKKKKVYWNDIKIVPSDDFSSYQFILKGDSAFETLSCTPIIDNQKDKALSVQQQKSWKRKHVLYSNIRRKRAATVNKFIIKTKQDLMILKEKEKAQKWAEFQTLFMSKEEKKLSRSEWLQYYQEVMNDEANILLNSDANFTNIRNALDANGYSSSFMSDYRKDTTYIEVYADFVNSDDFLYSVSNIVVVNKTKRSFYSLIGSSSNKMNGFVINKNDDFAVAVETITGQILVVDGAQIRNKSQRSNVCRFTVIAINKKMGTVSQVFNLLGL
jgi:hypothetical protein